MKRIIIGLLMLLALALAFAGCGQVTGYDPAGETGGGDNGYGNQSPVSMNLDAIEGLPVINGIVDFDYWRA